MKRFITTFILSKLLTLKFLKTITFLLLGFKNADETHANEPSSVRQTREIEKEFPPDTPDLDRIELRLDIPTKLFGQLAPDVAIRASTVIGSLIQVSYFYFLIPNFKAISIDFWVIFFFKLEHSSSLCGIHTIFQAVVGQSIVRKRFISTRRNNFGPECN